MKANTSSTEISSTSASSMVESQPATAASSAAASAAATSFSPASVSTLNTSSTLNLSAEAAKELSLSPLLIIDFLSKKEDDTKDMHEFFDKLIEFRKQKAFRDTSSINWDNKSQTYIVTANKPTDKEQPKENSFQLFYGENTVKSMKKALESLAKSTPKGAPINIHIEGHGTIYGKAHHISFPDPNKHINNATSLNLMKTSQIFSMFKKILPENPLNILLISCYGGQAQADVDQLPAGSTLVTLSDNSGVERVKPITLAFKNYPHEVDSDLMAYFEPLAFAKRVLSYSDEKQYNTSIIDYIVQALYPEKLLIGKVGEGVKQYILDLQTLDVGSETYKVAKTQLQAQLGKEGQKALGNVLKQAREDKAQVKLWGKKIPLEHACDGEIEGAKSLVALYLGKGVEFKPNTAFFTDVAAKKVILSDAEFLHITSTEIEHYLESPSLLDFLNDRCMIYLSDLTPEQILEQEEARYKSSENKGYRNPINHEVLEYIAFSTKPDGAKFVNFGFALGASTSDTVNNIICNSIRINDDEFHALHTGKVDFYEFVLDKTSTLRTTELQERLSVFNNYPKFKPLVEIATKAVSETPILNDQAKIREFAQSLLKDDTLGHKVFRVFSKLLQTDIKHSYDLAQQEPLSEKELLEGIARSTEKSEEAYILTYNEVKTEVEPMQLVQHELNTGFEQYETHSMDL
jgi:hypothetical protein